MGSRGEGSLDQCGPYELQGLFVPRVAVRPANLPFTLKTPLWS